MKRVLVIGSSGAGKSVLSRKLGEVTGLPVIHLDYHHWQPGWTEPSKQGWAAKVGELLDRDEWIMDGNFGGTMEQRLRRCDTVVFLDFPRHTCIWGVIKRVITYHGDVRPDLPPGCPEKFDLAFLKWIWEYPERSRPAVLQRIAAAKDGITVHRFTSRKQVDRFVADLDAQHKNGNS